MLVSTSRRPGGCAAIGPVGDRPAQEFADLGQAAGLRPCPQHGDIVIVCEAWILS